MATVSGSSKFSTFFHGSFTSVDRKGITSYFLFTCQMFFFLFSFFEKLLIKQYYFSHRMLKLYWNNYIFSLNNHRIGYPQSLHKKTKYLNLLYKKHLSLKTKTKITTSFRIYIENIPTFQLQRLLQLHISPSFYCNDG